MSYTATIIPTMTSASAPSGVVTCSGEYSGNEGWRAFDGSTAASNGWANTSITGWLCYQFPAAHVVTQYALTGFNHAAPRGPRSWTFHGSNNGTSWDLLDTQAHSAAWTALEHHEYPIANTTAYLYYRLSGDADWTEDALCLGELEMMETESAAHTTLTLVSERITHALVRLALVSERITHGGPEAVRLTLISSRLTRRLVLPGGVRLTLTSRRKTWGAAAAVRLSLISARKTHVLTTLTLVSERKTVAAARVRLTLLSERITKALTRLTLSSARRTAMATWTPPDPPILEVDMEPFAQINGIPLHVVGEMSPGGKPSVYDVIRHYDGSLVLHDLRSDLYERGVPVKVEGTSSADLSAQEAAICAACAAGGSFVWQSIEADGTPGTLEDIAFAPSDMPSFVRNQEREALWWSYATLVLKVWPS